MVKQLIEVEVVYGTAEQQWLMRLKVREQASIQEVILASGILTVCEEIKLDQCRIGVFSKSCSLEDSVKAGDRIEIYRPLLIEPKDARRAKARKKISVQSSLPIRHSGRDSSLV